ncbi:MAG TPA: hypothetical protein VGB30_11640 [bacterium]|jgi:hypothetical protein
MVKKSAYSLIIAILAAIPAVILAISCSPAPPIAYQQLQISDSEESEGYDVYMYVAVDKASTADEVTNLLNWFENVKYPDVNRMAIFVWTNPQGALINADGDLAGSIEIDRAEGKRQIRIR